MSPARTRDTRNIKELSRTYGFPRISEATFNRKYAVIIAVSDWWSSEPGDVDEDKEKLEEEYRNVVMPLIERVKRLVVKARATRVILFGLRRRRKLTAEVEAVIN